MANLKDIRGRIKGVKSTQQVTKAMKMVAASKLKRAQDRMFQLRPYATKMNELMQNVMATLELESLPSELTEAREVKNVLVVLVTSNRGLAGPFNTNIIKHALDFIKENYAEVEAKGGLHMLCIGQKGYEFFKKRGYNMVGENHDVFSGLSFDKVNDVIDQVFEGFLSEKYDRVHLVYNEFKNVMSQNKIAANFLPLSLEDVDTGDSANQTEYIYEPDKEEILSDLIPRVLRIKAFRAVLESNASEHGARMVAMDAATENAEELLKELKLSYNKARQAAITKEILEISAGADALKAG